MERSECHDERAILCESTKFTVDLGSKKNWNEARQKCIDRGLILARILTDEDQTIVENLLNDGDCGGCSAWIGACCSFPMRMHVVDRAPHPRRRLLRA